MGASSDTMTVDERRRGRIRRLDRMKARSASVARQACLACPVMGLLWVLGLWYEIPTWAIAFILLVALPGVLLLSRVVMRGKTVREPDERRGRQYDLNRRRALLIRYGVGRR